MRAAKKPSSSSMFIAHFCLCKRGGIRLADPTRDRLAARALGKACIAGLTEQRRKQRTTNVHSPSHPSAVGKRPPWQPSFEGCRCSFGRYREILVPDKGFEPLTFALQMRCSTN